MSVNSPAARVQRIREWRDLFHPSDSRVDAAHWHDVNLLLAQLKDAERTVRQLAACEQSTCVFCGTIEGVEVNGVPAGHDDDCPVGLAREWVEAHPAEGEPA